MSVTKCIQIIVMYTALQWGFPNSQPQFEFPSSSNEQDTELKIL